MTTENERKMNDFKSQKSVETSTTSKTIESVIDKDFVPGTGIRGELIRPLTYLIYERGFMTIPEGYSGVRSYFGSIDNSNTKIEPGLRWLFPVIMQYAWLVNTKMQTIDIPPQEILIGNFQVTLDATLDYQIIDPLAVIIHGENIETTLTKQVSTSIQACAGKRDIYNINSEREKIGEEAKDMANQYLIDKIGVEIGYIGLQGVDVPEEMEKALAQEALEKSRAKGMKEIADAEVYIYDMCVKMATKSGADPLEIYKQMTIKYSSDKGNTILIPMNSQYPTGLLTNGVQDILGKGPNEQNLPGK